MQAVRVSAAPARAVPGVRGAALLRLRMLPRRQRPGRGKRERVLY